MGPMRSGSMNKITESTARVFFFLHDLGDYARRIRMQARWAKARKREASLS